MAATKKKLTQTVADKAGPNEKIWDTEIKGFYLVTGKTKKTLYYQKDVNRKTVRHKLGSLPEITVAAARVEAEQLRAEHATGAVAQRLAASRIPTLRDATDTYLARPKLRSEHNKNQVRAQMENKLTDWLDLRLDEITKADCVAMHARLGADGERAANHVLKSFRSIYNHARRVHDLGECPTMAIEWFPEPASGKIIDDLGLWKEAVDGLENDVHRAFYRFLLFTGLRLSEALSLRWDQVHADHLHLRMTKNGRPFDLPLLVEHHGILQPMQAYRSDYVFPGTRHALHLKSPERIAWSAHAHRRTFATVAAQAGLWEEQIGRLLNHTPQSVTGAHYVKVGPEELRPSMQTVVDAFKRKGLI